MEISTSHPKKKKKKRKKAYLYATLKRLTSEIRTHIDWRLNDGKINFMQIEITWRLVYLYSYNKIDFKTKTIRRQAKALHNGNGINPVRKYIYKHIFTEHGAPRYIKQILMDLKGEIKSNTYETAKETLMYRTVFWTLWERERVGWFGRTALKHV